MLKKNTFGFTLVELLVVIAIISILSGLTVVNLVGARQRGQDVRRKSELAQLRTALRLFNNDFQRFPDMTDGTDLAGCDDGATDCGGPGAVFEANGTTYMKALPAEFEYYSDGLNQYVLLVDLVNESDEDALESQNRCDVASRAYVTVTPGATTYAVCEE